MKSKIRLFFILTSLWLVTVYSQEQTASRPPELEILKAYVGVWDAEIRVWPHGPDSTMVTFSGVETNRAFGQYWIASDFDSEFNGRKVTVHSIVGYDLDQKKLVGMVIDEGPYAATMTGEYDAETKTVHWLTKGKMPDGQPLIQKSTDTLKSSDERLLIMKVPGKKENEWVKLMEIHYIRRK